MLKKITLLAAFGLATAATAAFATPVCSNNVTGNGATYFGGGYSCEIGDLLFSNFTYTPSGTDPIGASQITVDVVTNNGIGLSFHAPWDATSNETSDGTIDFTVTVVGGGKILADFGLAQTSGVSGTGFASVAENGCGPAPCTATGGPLWLYTFQDGGSRTATDEMNFSKTYSSLSVEKDITVKGGTNGTATLSVVQDTFSQVPEPLSMGLMGGGLALLGLSRLRRRSKKT